jgi:hypothetical protein
VPVDVLAFEYDLEALSSLVWKRANRALQDCSVWRMRPAGHSDRWIIVVVDPSGKAREFDWSPGRPYQLDLGSESLFVQRHLQATGALTR